MKTFAEIAFTDNVRALQEAHGSRTAYARVEAGGFRGEGLGPQETGFLSGADNFFLATVSETGWPYVQHRGGPAGFVKIISPTRIAWAEFRGNRQYVSTGNAVKNNRASLIVMDYAHRQRLKLLGRLQFKPVAEADEALGVAVQLPGYRARVEAVAVIDVEAFDWNCPQHITQRFTLAQIETATRPLHDRIAQLETALKSS